MGHADQADFLADLLLARDRFSVLGHVGDLAEEAGRASLATGIGVDLRIEHDDFDRLAGHQRAGHVLEPDVVHRAIAAERHDRRAEFPFLVGELFPIEIGQVFGSPVSPEDSCLAAPCGSP